MIGKTMDKLTNLIYGSKFSIFLLLFFLLLIVFNGIWVAPSAYRMFLLSSDPYANPFENPRDEWLLDNYLLPWLAHTVGMSFSFEAYIAFCGVVLLGGLLICILAIKFYCGDLKARSVSILFLASPVSLVCTGWIGYVDSITILYGFLLALAWNHLPVLCLGGLVMGASHYSQGVAISLVAFLAHLACEENKSLWFTHVRSFIFVVACVLVSHLALKLYYGLYGIEQSFNRLDYIYDKGLQYYVDSFARSIGLLFYSLFGAAWLLVIKHTLFVKITHRQLLIFLAILISFGVTFLSLDQTRVFSLMSWPLLLVLVNKWSSQEESEQSQKRFMVVLLLAALLLPKVVIWDGKPYGPLTHHNIQYILDRADDQEWDKPIYHHSLIRKVFSR